MQEETTLEKTYEISRIEAQSAVLWEEKGAFRAAAGAREGAKPYCIMMPPPNVTGSLHMGHALNNTLQDILIRFRRMQGWDVLWQPGMDHAGIATQMVVERQLAAAGEPNRHALGRKTFTERIWKWKNESGGRIFEQLRRLGASCDWSLARFTLDEGASAAVLEAFVRLHAAGLLYRDKRLVNWDPKLRTAISDLEVQQIETQGHLWYFRYPLLDDPERSLTVATTRPETMLGDTAVAVHPEDPRMQDLIGRKLRLPLIGRIIPVIADSYVDPEAGSGAVKITPAHDFNDFEVGRRHRLPMVTIFDEAACLSLRKEEFWHGIPDEEETRRATEAVCAALEGMDRLTARAAIVARMEAGGFLEQVVPHIHVVPHGDRSQVIIEPFLTDQWYVDAQSLAGRAIEAVRSGKTKFVPDSWSKTYFEWMENIQPWCISRQLWWGHRIPAYYGPDGRIFVAKTAEEACTLAQAHYGRRVQLETRKLAEAAWASAVTEAHAPLLLYQDEDVLDTWFSSALWPFSTLGWPGETPALARYYPNQVLVTAFDIIFFWVARMLMAGLYFMEEVPFQTVYIHALVRDEKGQKMSKSKGNVIDPLGVIERYGADALRFTLAAMAAQGRDVKLTETRIAGYRNFTTKLWNAVRFSQMNQCSIPEGFDPMALREELSQWLVSEFYACQKKVEEALEAFRFNEAAQALYHFVWHILCDWYVELMKPILGDAGESGKTESAAGEEIRATLAWSLAHILKLLHPFIPFLTEALWQKVYAPHLAPGSILALSHWPERPVELPEAYLRADAAITQVTEIIAQIRSIRAEMRVPAAEKIPLIIVRPEKSHAAFFSQYGALIQRLARLNALESADGLPKGAVQIVVGPLTLCLVLEGVLDLAAEKARLQKILGVTHQKREVLQKKLANESFLKKAREEIVQEERERLIAIEQEIGHLEGALQRINQAL